MSEMTRLLTIAETAKALRLSVRTVHAITAPRGELPCIRLGRRKLYNPADVEAFVASCRVGKATPVA